MNFSLIINIELDQINLFDSTVTMKPRGIIGMPIYALHFYFKYVNL